MWWFIWGRDIIACDKKLWEIVIACMLGSNVTARILDPGVRGRHRVVSELGVIVLKNEIG